MPTSLPNEFTLSVTLTRDDVQRGCRMSSSACPWARAIMRALARYVANVTPYAVNVSASNVAINAAGIDSIYGDWTANLPSEVEDWIDVYDRLDTIPDAPDPQRITFRRFGAR